MFQTMLSEFADHIFKVAAAIVTFAYFDFKNKISAMKNNMCLIITIFPLDFEDKTINCLIVHVCSGCAF